MRQVSQVTKMVVFLLVAPVLTHGSEVADSNEMDGAELEVSGVSGVSFGQIVKGLSNASQAEMGQKPGRLELEKDVLLGWDLWLDIEVGLTPTIAGFLGGGGLINYDVYARDAKNDRNRRLLQAKGSFFGITKTYLKFGFLDGAKWDLKLSAGYFPFKYAPDARNLGEYLFRTEAYPNLIFTGGLDNSAPSILGIRFRSAYESWLVNDLLLTSETERHPFFDLSVSDIVTVKAGDVFEIGIGGSLWRFLPADPKFTSPGENVPWETLTRLEQIEGYQYMYWDSTAADPDTTSSFTMQATKVIGRLAFTPRPLIPWDAFGDNDLKLYAEAAVLGVKNYPHFYEDRLQRIPVMVGFNVPTFNILDVLSIELEQHLYEYSSSIVYKNEYNSPLPEPVLAIGRAPGSSGELLKEKVHIFEVEDNFKWSIYFKKVLAHHFQIQGQFAKDHLRLPDYEGVISDRPNFEAYGDWYYQLKMQYFF